MTTDTATPIRPSRARLDGVTPLGPDLHQLVPDAVRDASERFRSSLEDQQAAHVALKAAEAELEAAEREDRRLAEEAVLNGKAAPKPLRPKAAEALAAAQRQVEATVAAATTLQNSYLDAVRGEHGAIRDAALEHLDGTNGRILDAINALEAALVDAAAAHVLLRELGDDQSTLGGRAVVFQPTRPNRRGRDVLAGEQRELLDRARELVS